MNHFQLTELIYDTDLHGALALHIYNHAGRYTTQYFRATPRYPDEETTARKARFQAEQAIREGREVRITNGSDFLVFHAKDGELIHPPCGKEEFWRQVAESGR